MSHVAHLGGAERATRAAIAVATRQHGRISRAQLEAVGWTRSTIGARVAAGWLVREHRGVYRLSGVPASLAGHGAAAVLAVGGEAAIIHRSGLEHHGVLDPLAGAPVHVTIARNHRSRPGIVVHQAPLAEAELVRIAGLRVATLTRCLVDAAAVEPPGVVRRAVREAEVLRLVDADALGAAVCGRPGAALLRGLADERLPVRGDLREELERRFAVFLRDRGLPPAEVNHALVLRRPTQRVVLDVVWWEAGLAAELDSRKGT